MRIAEVCRNPASLYQRNLTVKQEPVHSGPFNQLDVPQNLMFCDTSFLIDQQIIHITKY